LGGQNKWPPQLNFMELSREINWYAIHAKPSREEAAALNIGRLGLDVFLPKIKKEKLVWGKSQIVIKPLFTCYLFARFSPAAYLHLIRYARGVRRVVSAGEVPLIVDEEIIKAIQPRVEEDGYIRMESGLLAPGDRVVIQEGPLQGLLGIFVRELGDRERVAILLETIGYQASALTEKRYLKLAPEVG
jgi:transcriptional antiterminator RfaH